MLALVPALGWLWLMDLVRYSINMIDMVGRACGHVSCLDADGQVVLYFWEGEVEEAVNLAGGG